MFDYSSNDMSKSNYNYHIDVKQYIQQEYSCFQYSWALLMQEVKQKKIKKGKNIEQHLIQKLVVQRHKEEETVQEEVGECKYGVNCAHLRMQGECRLRHKRNHYLFLNIVPPNNCVDEVGQQQEKKLSKKQRKEKKILQKTINSQINLVELKKREQQKKKQRQAELKKQLMNLIDEKEKRVIDLLSCTDVSAFFQKLNEYRQNKFDLFQIKRRALMQLKKKNEQLYKDIVDREYRIANRLIKAAKKGNEKLMQIYTDINHDSIPSVRDYFEHYLLSQSGIPLEAKQNKLQPIQKLYVSKILGKMMYSKPQEYDQSYYAVQIQTEQDLSEIKSNIQFFNLMVPFSLSKGQQFNKYYFIDCEEQLSLANISNILTKDHLKTFHAKSKAASDYPFGLLPENIKKFKYWASKIAAKFNQIQKKYKIIFVLNNVKALLSGPNTQQFQSQKIKERQATIQALNEVFSPVFIFLTPKQFSSQQDLAKIVNSTEQTNVEIKKLSIK